MTTQSQIPNNLSTSNPLTTQPTSQQGCDGNEDAVSYEDSDTHAQQFYCCVMRCFQSCCARITCKTINK